MRPSTPTDLELDFQERAGFQIGRAAAFADYEFRREQRGFAKLCARIYQRNWQRKLRREHPEKARSKLQAWRNKNRERVRAMDRARRARKRKPIRLLCQNADCRKTFSPKRYRTAKFCTRSCRNHVHGVARARRRNRGIRNMALAATVRRILSAAPDLTLAELHARAPGVKRGSLATKLTAWGQAGDVTHDGARKNRRYRWVST